VKALDREILRLSLPSILANITVPLVGLVDTAVAGHLHSAAGTSAEFIGGISVGAMVLNVIYWNFAFLRASTGGLTAQAFGAGDGYVPILRRALKLALGFAVAMIALGWPISRIALLFRDATPNVAALAIQYVLIRIWAAPATLSLMALKGWFIGMQDTRSSMFADLTVNVVNIAASIILTLGIGSWQGLGFPGIALGTVIAQYSGLLLALAICIFRYRIPVCSRKCPETGTNASNNGVLFRKTAENGNGFFHLNANLFVRSLCMTAIYFGYTFIASRYGETMLACANIMMNLLMIFSYFTDGFAYAGEALTGRFIGEGDGGMLRAAVRGTFRWSFGVAGIWIAIYLAAGVPMLHMMTDDPTVVDACRQFLPWLAVMPLIGCAAFTWDGIYIGATASKGIRDSMIWAVAAFFGVWFAGRILPTAGAGAIHLLLGAYFAHLAARAILLTLRYRGSILLQK
jgi:MATE family multidrug resistance protein